MKRTLLVLVAALAFAAPARAALITVDFFFNGHPFDPINAGTVAHGTFSFDDGLIPYPDPSLPFPNGDFATTILFMWDGVVYNNSNATLYQLRFDSEGRLWSWSLGADVNGVDGVSATGSPDFAVSTDGYVYAHGGNLTYDSDSPDPPERVTWTVHYPVAPEPGTLALLAISAPFLFWRARRRDGGGR